MTTKEKIEGMQHYEDGGKVEHRRFRDSPWILGNGLMFDWISFEYRIKLKPVEMLYEWWYENDSMNRYVHGCLMSDVVAKKYFTDDDIRTYGRTGRYLNPTETTEIFHSGEKEE